MILKIFWLHRRKSKESDIQRVPRHGRPQWPTIVVYLTFRFFGPAPATCVGISNHETKLSRICIWKEYTWRFTPLIPHPTKSHLLSWICHYFPKTEINCKNFQLFLKNSSRYFFKDLVWRSSLKIFFLTSSSKVSGGWNLWNFTPF